jgi:hypothetical protein
MMMGGAGGFLSFFLYTVWQMAEARRGTEALQMAIGDRRVTMLTKGRDLHFSACGTNDGTIFTRSMALWPA